MLFLLHTHWLLFFSGLALGIVVGWLTYLRDATRWTDRPVHIAIGAVAIGAILAIAKVVPGRYGYWLELGVILAVFYTVGCFIGWALRDLAESMPAAAKPGMGAPAATTGSYLFHNAFAGMGASTVYMRTLTAGGGVARERMAFSTGAITRAPAPGGYTFPKTLPFADATTSRRSDPVTGMRRHWSWPRPVEAASVTAAVPEFTGSKGGYVFPVAVGSQAFAGATRVGVTRAGQYRHWTWRGAAAPAERDVAAPAEGAPVAPPAFGSSVPAGTGVGLRDTPIVSEPAGATPTEAIEAPSNADGIASLPDASGKSPQRGA